MTRFEDKPSSRGKANASPMGHLTRFKYRYTSRDVARGHIVWLWPKPCSQDRDGPEPTRKHGLITQLFEQRGGINWFEVDESARAANIQSEKYGS